MTLVTLGTYDIDTDSGRTSTQCLETAVGYDGVRVTTEIITTITKKNCKVTNDKNIKNNRKLIIINIMQVISSSLYLQLRGGPLQLGGREGLVRLVRRGSTARVPDGGALQKHLLAIAKGVSALGAACACGVEVMVFAGL